jgi:PTS system nitrogen regulatory IIA component
MLSDRSLRDQLKAAETAEALHKLISDWAPLKSVA